MDSAAVLRTAMHPVDVLELKGVKSLGRLSKELGERKLLALIKIHLLDLNALLDLSNPMTERQIDFVANQLLGQYRNLTMVDVYLVLKRCKTGYYGALYERLNPPKILKWFAEYFDERCSVAANKRYEEHISIKESPHEERLSETSVKDMMNAYRDAKWKKRNNLI